MPPRRVGDKTCPGKESLLSLQRLTRCLSRIDGNRDHREILAGFQTKDGETLAQAGLDERAEHRAPVIGKREDDGSCTEIVGQANDAPILIGKHQVIGQPLAELLIEAYLVKGWLEATIRHLCFRMEQTWNSKCGDKADDDAQRLAHG